MDIVGSRDQMIICTYEEQQSFKYNCSTPFPLPSFPSVKLSTFLSTIMASRTITTMKAAVLHQAGGPEVLKIQQWPKPVPALGQVLIRVKAFGLN